MTDEQIVEVLLVHPGGPFWSKRDDGSWSIPKGEHESSEDPWEVARREFAEELGSPPPSNEGIDLGEVRQASGKRVHAWAVEGGFDTSHVHSNTFTMEWPPHSGTNQAFPEVDRASWFTVAHARRKLVPGQVLLLDKLKEHLGASRDGIGGST
jgi:predicted NUDIX family NTP pyrophosphohydrolase